MTRLNVLFHHPAYRNRDLGDSITDILDSNNILSQCSKVCQQKSGSNKGLKPLVQHQHFRLMA